jgi:hypothetical protein
MQTITSYLVNQIIPVEIFDDTTPTIRNRIVYAKIVKAYKNVDNTLELRFVNQDQKPVTIVGNEIKFYLVDQELQQVLLTKVGVMIDDGSTLRHKGLARIIISGSDLINIPAGFYNYAVKLIDNNVNPPYELIGYTNDNYGATGQLQVLRGVYPDIDSVATDDVDEYDLGNLTN